MMEGACADSEEKHEPVSDADIVVVKSLNAFDPKHGLDKRTSQFPTGRVW